MPAISTGKVLVTGANGFIAVWTVKAFLDAGFSVRGAMRSASKSEHLKALFSSYGDKLELVVVPDMVEPGAFDDAILGVDAIVHTASPVHLAADDPAEVIDPAVNGTLGLLRSAAAKAASVQRVVYLSSCAAVLTRDAPEPRVYDETCWNDADARAVETLGRGAPPLAKYSASKIFAERSAWSFYEEHKGALSWDLVVVNPPWVFGPVLHEVRGGPESLNDSNRILFDAITKGARVVTATATSTCATLHTLSHSLSPSLRQAGSASSQARDLVVAAAGKISTKIPRQDVSHNFKEQVAASRKPPGTF